MRQLGVWFCALVACASAERSAVPGDGGTSFASDASTTSNKGDAGRTNTCSSLEDDHNCGECGHDCTLCGGTCQAGVCTLAVLDSALAAPHSIAVDDTYVYYADEVPYLVAGGVIYAVPKSGGPRVTLATNQRAPWGIAIDATGLYWSDATSDTGAIMKLAPGATEPTELAAANGAINVTVDNGNAIWTSGTLWELPAGSNAPIDLDTTANSTKVPCETISNGIAYYFVGATPNEIRRAAPGLPPTTIATTSLDLGPYQTIVVSGDTVFLALFEAAGSDFAGTIASVPVTGGTPSTIQSNTRAAGIAADASNIYWIGYSPSTTTSQIYKSGLDGSNPTILSATIANTTGYLALDDRCVYLTTADLSSGTVMAVAK